MRTWLRRVLLWIVFTGVYMLLISKMDPLEWLLGSVVSILCVLGVEAYLHTGLVYFRPRWKDLLQIRHLPVDMLSGTAQTLHALWNQLFAHGRGLGDVKATRYRLGGLNPESAARRALTISYSTATPNSIVLGFWPDPSMTTSFHAELAGPTVEYGLMLYHQVLPVPTRQWMRELGAEG